MLRRLLPAVGVAAVLALTTACAGGSAAPSTPSPAATETETAALTGDLTIYAAASLRAVFDEMATAFTEENPDVTVVPIVYDGSSTLATQIIGGAQPDVFASADEANMTKVTDEGLADGAELFATNTLVIVVPAGNPGGVEDLSDLAEDSVTVVLCAAEVPCGAASQTLLSNAGVTVAPASLEQNVTAVLTKVQSGEADAGLVYVTDVRNQPDIESIEPEGATEVVNRYPIAALTDAPNAVVAEAFIQFVLGAGGQALLSEYGFGAP